MSVQRAFFLSLGCGVLTASSPLSAQEPRSTPLQTPRQQIEIVRCEAFSPDGKSLATASAQYQGPNRWLGMVKLWDMVTARDTDK